MDYKSFKNKFTLSSSWMYVSGTGICKVFAFFTVGFMAKIGRAHV